MKKRFLLIAIMLNFFLVDNVIAHTGLKSSVPNNEENVEDEIKQIILNFDTKIELTSTLEVEDATGELVKLESVDLTDNKMVANLLNPLENGEYLVNWKIVGADGHPIEGNYSFTVALPINEETIDQDAEVQPQQKPEVDNSETERELITEKSQNSLPPYAIPAILGTLILALVVSFLIIMKRKK